MKNLLRKVLVVIFATAISTMFISCGSSDDAAPVVLEAPIDYAVGSTWSMTEKVNAVACGEGYQTDTYVMTVFSQSGTSITMQSTNGRTYSGTFSGNKISLSGSHSDGDGVSQGSLVVTMDSSCNSMSGSGTWVWSDGKESCAGTSEITGYRNDSPGCKKAP